MVDRQSDAERFGRFEIRLVDVILTKSVCNRIQFDYFWFQERR